jgi:hypothetical protein
MMQEIQADRDALKWSEGLARLPHGGVLAISVWDGIYLGVRAGVVFKDTAAGVANKHGDSLVMGPNRYISL